MSATVTGRDARTAREITVNVRSGEFLTAQDKDTYLRDCIAAAIAAERERAEAPLRECLSEVQDNFQEAHARITELENLRAAEERTNRDQHKALCRREETITKLTRERDEDRAHNRQLRADDVALRGRIIVLTRERDEAAQERERWKDTAQKAANEALRRAPPTYPTDRTETL